MTKVELQTSKYFTTAKKSDRVDTLRCAYHELLKEIEPHFIEHGDCIISITTDYIRETAKFNNGYCVELMASSRWKLIMKVVVTTHD